MINAPSVEFRDGTLLVDGRARVLLCSSLLPFRLPAEQWEQRMLAVKAMGYHCLDVYVPWNHHESGPGRYCFEGHKDLAGFLDLARRHNLMVLLRPGPYICSEFDGGGLPARLATVPGLRVRQHEPQYLGQVAAWFAAILPIVAEHQWPHGGPIIALQLENELDFFSCDDPSAYVLALRDMVTAHDIKVPLIVCAGQGDFARAGGSVTGVVPGINLYTDDMSLSFGQLARHYVQQLQDRGFPALVIETNRLHRTLKRLIGAGAAFLGPYPQTGGWNFDCDSATNNWGCPIGFITSDYDFGGAIAPNGAERPDAAAGRLLSHFIDALGERLARARPLGPVLLHEGLETAQLALFAGGQLTTVTNLSGRSRQIETSSVAWTLADGENRLIVTDVPLGDGLVLEVTTGELWDLVVNEKEIRLVVQAPGDKSVILHGTRWGAQACETSVDTLTPGATSISPAQISSSQHFGDVSVVIDEIEGRLKVRGDQGRVSARMADGRALTIELLDAAQAAMNGAPTKRERPMRRQVDANALRLSTVQDQEMNTSRGHEHPVAWEDLGHGRGGGSYRTTLPAGGFETLMLSGAADVVSVHANGQHKSHFSVGGQDVLVPWAPSGYVDHVEVRVATWGHSNFDDARLPSLALLSRRGLRGAAVLGPASDISGGWEISADPEGLLVGRDPLPVSDFGRWSSTERPLTLSFARRIIVPTGHDVCALHVPNLRVPVAVALDGIPAGMLSPLSPVLRLGASEGLHLLELRVTLLDDEQLGRPGLLTGVQLRGWQIEHTSPEQLAASAEGARRDTIPVSLPFHVPAGARRWLVLDLAASLSTFGGADLVLRIESEDIFTQVFALGRGVGRLWSKPPEGATLTGGRGDFALIPAPWAASDPIVTLLLEATSHAGGVLRALVLSDDLEE